MGVALVNSEPGKAVARTTWWFCEIPNFTDSAQGYFFNVSPPEFVSEVKCSGQTGGVYHEYSICSHFFPRPRITLRGERDGSDYARYAMSHESVQEMLYARGARRFPVVNCRGTTLYHDGRLYDMRLVYQSGGRLPCQAQRRIRYLRLHVMVCLQERSSRRGPRPKPQGRALPSQFGAEGFPAASLLVGAGFPQRK